MGFGIRLGPFRVGTGGAGVNAGPFYAGTGYGGGRGSQGPAKTQLRDQAITDYRWSIAQRPNDFLGRFDRAVDAAIERGEPGAAAEAIVRCWTRQLGNTKVTMAQVAGDARQHRMRIAGQYEAAQKAAAKQAKAARKKARRNAREQKRTSKQQQRLARQQRTGRAELDVGNAAPVDQPDSTRRATETGWAPPTSSMNQPQPAQRPNNAERVDDWVLPPLSLLKRAGQPAFDMGEIERRSTILHHCFNQHGVESELIGMTVGPTLTRYELDLSPGVKVTNVASLERRIVEAMATTDVRVRTGVPGRFAIWVEVPNQHRQLVHLGDVLMSPEAGEATHPLEVAIGQDVIGRAVFLNLSTTPHLLIAGATGTGKSSGINCILTSMLMRTTPDQVRLILIDPRQVEMGRYSGVPHLLTEPVTNPKKAASALRWVVKEMERRYDVLSAVGYRDITAYNAAVARRELEPPPGVADEESPYEHMPYIVVAIDEFNDLVEVAARDVEESTTRIVHSARAVGIHLIVATQRPTVNVIDGAIKANMPGRIAFAVSSIADSLVILDEAGAEKLLGRGDMFLLTRSTSAPIRIQGAFVGEEEVRQVVSHWRSEAREPIYAGKSSGEDQVTTRYPPVDGAVPATRPGELNVASDVDTPLATDEVEDADMLGRAMKLVVRSQLGSTSMLQRKLKIDFARAGHIMDLLEQRGVVGPSQGSKAREVLMTVEAFEVLQRPDGL